MTEKIPNTTPFLIFPLHVLKKHGKRSVVLKQPSLPTVDNHLKITNAYEAYSPLLLRYCLLRVSNKEEAIDIVQETYTRAWLYLVKGNTIDIYKSFLFTIAHHLIVDGYRKKKSISLEYIMNTQEEPRTNTKEEQYLREDIARVLSMIETLPEHYRSVLLMRYVEDFSVKEIAAILKKTDTAISVRIHRGIKKLQKSIRIC